MNYQLENLISNLEGTSPSSELVLFKENHIRDISLLNENFDLSSMPSNYMRKRSKIEEIIYKAVFNQNTHKSPFASFKIANDCLSDLKNIDIVTGTNNLKKVLKSAYADNEQISIMVHKIGNTWLMDEFDHNALFLGHQHYVDWNWLREFIERDRLQLTKPDQSRASLTLRDLYAKFLYHSVNPLSIQLPENNDETCSQVDNIPQLPISKPQKDFNLRSNNLKFSSSSNRYDYQREDFINLVDWKLNDLSFVVGSDLSIFGTKTHPCISLRLHPSQEPINILTGIDMWLENLLNEVPEVAMCYHDQGIVMREYGIFRTEEIPQIAGFDKDEVESIAKNLSHFLSINATKEGHTYWLFKETDSNMVKLYDLTDIWMQSQHNGNQNKSNARHTPDCNPFILPVAVLCYKMAENRINQWHRARNKRGNSNLTSSQFNKELLDNKLADDIYYFNDIFRLLKNCINLLIRTDKHQDLVNKAIILMCQLYLEVDQTTLNNLHHQQEPRATGIVKFELSDLKSIEKVQNSTQLISSSTNQNSYDDSNLIGSQLYQLCVKNSTEELFVKTLSILEKCDIERNKFNFTDEEVILRNTLLSDSKEVSTLTAKRTTVNESLINSVTNYYVMHCIEPDVSKITVDTLQTVLKSGFMVEMLDGNLWSPHINITRDERLYCNLINGFIRWHVELQGAGNNATDNILDKMDCKVIGDYCSKHSVKIVEVTTFFRSIFMPESKRMCLNISDIVHNCWFKVIQFLMQLSNQLIILELNKLNRISIQRALPLLVNFLVAAIVKIYQQKSSDLCDQDLSASLQQWCKDTVFSSIELIRQWINIADFCSNIEATFLALVWTNKAKLYRLSMAIFDDNKYLYHAIESYTKAIETLVYTSKKKIPPMSVGLKCDRLDMCIQLLERTYGSLIKNIEDSNDSMVEMNGAFDVSDKIYRTESSIQGYSSITTRLTSLRLRMNYVRYYLNLKNNKPLNFEQILNDFQSDMRLIQTEEDSISKCKESLLIMFYLIKIEADRLEILSAKSIEAFLKENTKILNDILVVDKYRAYLNTEGDSKLKEIYVILVNILRKLHQKYQIDSHRKKRNQRDPKVAETLKKYLSMSRPAISTYEEMKELLKEIKDVL